MTDEKVPVSPQALRFARDQMRISQRELGRRAARRLGRPEAAARAIQVRLSRLEQGDEISMEDRELLDALAAELAVGVGDLAEPPVWIWIALRDGRPGIVELAMRMPYYTSPELAYQARDWLAHASDGQFTPFRDAHLVPMRFHALTQDTLDVNYPDLSDRERRLLTVRDPGEEMLPFLAGLNAVLNMEVVEPWQIDSIAATIDKFELVGEIFVLQDLALRRLKKAPPHDHELLASWRRREERLNEILEHHHRLRREYRELTLSRISPTE